MAAKIQVEQLADGLFQVSVVEAASQSTHQVMLRKEDYDRLTGGKLQPAEFLRRSFQFLLEREPKESILSRFDLRDISRYFPDFEREIKRRIARA